MEYIASLLDIVFGKLDATIVLLVIAIGELVKRYWKSDSVNAFYKVLTPTLPIVAIYAYLSLTSPDVTLFSYLVAFWLYPLLVKPILIILGLKKRSSNRSRADVGGELPDTDDEN